MLPSGLGAAAQGDRDRHVPRGVPQEGRGHPLGHQAHRREGQGEDGTESWDLGSGAVRAAGQGSLDRNRSGLSQVFI